MQLLLIRHSETEEGKRGILLGQIHGNLSSSGKRQSKILAESLTGENLNAMYSSDLRRALQTADCIRRYHKDALFFIDPRIRERDYGIYNGSPLDYLLKNYRDENIFSRPEDGESLFEFRSRLKKFYDDIKGSYHHESRIAIISHASAIMELVEITQNDGITYPITRGRFPKYSSLRRVSL